MVGPVVDKDALVAVALATGADKVRVADLALLAGIETNPPDLLAPYTRAVSLAMALDPEPLADIVDRPTPAYATHFHAVNQRLKQLCEAVAAWLQEQGALARALLPTTEAFDPVRCMDVLSHKAVAVAAGIGWQGKSLVTVSPEYGPRIRLTTVLTNADLPADGPIRNRCAGCHVCAQACPAQAIRDVNTTWHYASRDEALRFERCRDKIRLEFAQLPGVGATICGVCVAVCPWGRKRLRGVG